MKSRLKLTRRQILTFRRRVGAFEERMPKGPESLQQAASAGLQDSMPRAALLSLHARVEGVEPSTWEDPSLIQLWGPRYQVYVVAKPDFPLFSLARLPDNEKGRLRAEQMAERLRAGLRGGRATGPQPRNALRNGEAGGDATSTRATRVRWGGDRERLVPQEDQQELLWTPRVGPGALLVDGEIRGTWRRAQHSVRVDAWGRV